MEGENYFKLGNKYYVEGNLEKAIEFYNISSNKGYNMPILFNNFGVAYKDKWELNKAIKCFKKAIKLDPKYRPPYSNLGLAFEEKKEYEKAILIFKELIKIKPDDPDFYYNLGICYWGKNESLFDFDFVKNLKKAINLCQDYIPALCTLAGLSESMSFWHCDFEKTMGLEDPEFYWSKIIDIITKKPELGKLRDSGETKNKVYIYLFDEVKKTFVIKENKTRKVLEDEKYIASRLYRELKFITQPDFVLPHTSSIRKSLRKGPQYLYLTSFISGDTLLSQIENSHPKLKQNIAKIVKYLYFIHSKIKSDNNIRLERLNCIKHIKDKLMGYGTNNLENKIINNLNPLIKTFDNSTWVFNKDAHPENWIILKNGKVGAIDFENKGLVPAEFDLVNLLEYFSYLSDEEKDNLIEEYQRCSEQKCSLKEKSQISSGLNMIKISQLSYLNAVIYRGLCFYLEWSSPKRKSMHTKRKKVIEDSLCAVKRIKKEHMAYFEEYKDNYNNLESILKNLKSS